MDEVDLALADAFGALDLTRLEDKRKWEGKVRLKGQILAGGLLAEPERKPDEKAVMYATALLKRHNIKLPPDNKLFRTSDIDAMGDKLSVSDRLHLKTALNHAGLLDHGTVAAKPAIAAPSPKLLKSVFGQLGIEQPHTLSVVALNRAMREYGISGKRALEVKATIHAAGLLVD